MCMCCAAILAQTTTQNAIQEINQIKRNSDVYYFAEATAQTWEEALENAKTLLSAQIEMWAKTEQSGNPVETYIARASEHLFEIKATRGQLFRAFVYVKKSEVLALSSNEDVLVVPIKGEESPSVTLVTPVQEEKEEEKEEEPTIQVEIRELSAFEKEILSVSSFSKISDFIRTLQSSNKISKMGKYSDMPQDEECYLFVYNPQGEIPAYMHKTTKGYFNLKTKTQDDIKNYKGCGALWFQLK